MAIINAIEVEACLFKTKLLWLEKCTKECKCDRGSNELFTLEDNFVVGMLDNRDISYFKAVKENQSVEHVCFIYTELFSTATLVHLFIKQ